MPRGAGVVAGRARGVAGAHEPRRGPHPVQSTNCKRPSPRPGRSSGASRPTAARCADAGDLTEALRNRQLCFAHAVYLEAVRFALSKRRRQPRLGHRARSRTARRSTTGWTTAGASSPEDPAFREQVLETLVAADGRVENHWVPRRPIPHDRRLVRDGLGTVSQRRDLRERVSGRV